MKTRQRKNKLTVLIIALVIITSYINAQYDTIISGKLERSYLLQLPNNYSEESNIPLILVLHGYHTENLGMPGYSGFNQFVDRNVIVAYPHGLNEENGNNYFWNSGGGHINNYGGVDDVGFIRNLIDTLSDEYAINKDSVFIVGHSNGGMMSYRLAMEISDKITAMANLAGSMMFDTIVPDQPVPILHIHGTNDQAVRLTGSTDTYWPFLPIADVLAQWVEWNNCLSEPVTVANTDEYEYLKWGDVNGNNQVLAVYLKGQGHDWATIRNNGWSISENIWSFFTTGYLLEQTSGVETISMNIGLKVYYSNRDRRLNISHPEKTISEVKVFNLSGENILTQSSTQNNISIETLAKGIYVVKVKLNEEIVSQKVWIY